ncbi:uncharacterized protein [Dysidea avara]|uniref:uncharacterized protein isoform X3 n=1 Tax=Dysidea avara TaxID=196820 RepID=UPI00331A93AA
MSEVIFRGYLHKSPPESFRNALKPWRQRWVILADSRLAFPYAQPYVRIEYYVNQQLAEDLDEPKGVIDLKYCTEVIARHPIRGYDHVFDICTEKRSYHFAAPTKESKGIWMESILSVLRSKGKPPGSPSVTPRLGLSVQDASIVSPVYQAVTLPNQSSDKMHRVPPPMRNTTLPGGSSLDDYQHLSHKKPPAIARTGPSSLYDTLSTTSSSQDDYQHLDHKITNVGRSMTSATSPSHYSHIHVTHEDYHQLSDIKTTNAHSYTPLHSSDSDNDDYNRLSHVVTSSESETRHPISNTSQYSSLALQDDYQHLKHNKSNEAAGSRHITNTSQYSTLALQDDYHHLNHKNTNGKVGAADNKLPLTYTNTSLTSQYSTLAIQDDDYQHLNHTITNGMHRTTPAALPPNNSTYGHLNSTHTYEAVTHNSSS